MSLFFRKNDKMPTDKNTLYRCTLKVIAKDVNGKLPDQIIDLNDYGQTPNQALLGAQDYHKAVYRDCEYIVDKIIQLKYDSRTNQWYLSTGGYVDAKENSYLNENYIK